ncbi:MAG: hypothetical protein Q4C46_05545 [Bacillota bacterium]|nr:hypothetical protein [Bacillota bacterium]
MEISREILKSKGEKVAEGDFYNNGIYAGTERFYLYGGRLYRMLDFDNRMNYNGRNITTLALDNPKDLRTLRCGIEVRCLECYYQMCERFDVEPNL